MKFIDLFAGIGGFRYGLEKANKEFECVWSNEWDKYASQIYKKHFGECDTRDIRTVKSSEIPDFDLLVGGFPCQTFSIAGKRKGFDDTRGTLFFEIARILTGKRSRYFLLENVKGLLSHDEGKTFQTILGVLSDLGYEFEWQVLNSKNFGVPQNRERVFIVGHLRGTSRPKVFPFTSDIRKNVTFDSPKGTSENEIASTLTVEYAKNQHGNQYVAEDNKAKRHPLKFLERNQKNIEGDYSFTVDGADTGGVKQGIKIRRLTPTECERLQGFPDGWTEYGLTESNPGIDSTLMDIKVSDTQRYKCLGNAVTTNVIEYIGKELLS